MAVVQHASFQIDGVAATSFGSSSSRVALPGTPGSDNCVRVANQGPCHITVLLGTGTVTVANNTGLMIPAGQVEYITIGTATYIAGISCGGPGTSSTANIVTGS